MQKVLIEKLRNWKMYNYYSMPGSLDCVCGFCGVLANLQTSNHTIHSETNTVLMQGRCIRCSEESTIYLINAKQNKNEMPDECWVHPKPEIREYKFTEADIHSPKIFRAYKEAIDLFNEGKPSPSIGACGRAVEGIAKEEFPIASTERDTIGSLFQKLESEFNQLLPRELHELLKPLLSLGKALRIGRNTGSHFNSEREPDQELAGKIIDLTEFLMQYVYILKDEASNVNTIIDNLSNITP
jgi:hypothetical protein